MRIAFWFAVAAVGAAALSARPSEALESTSLADQDAEVSITSPANGVVLASSSANIAVNFSSKEDNGGKKGKIVSIELLVNQTTVASFELPDRPKTGSYTFTGVNLSGFDNTGAPVSLVARAFTDKKGKKYVDSGAVRVTIQTDRTAPAVVILTPANGSAVGTRRPALSAEVTDVGGSGVNPASIVMKLDGTPVASTLSVVNPNKVTLTFTPPSDLNEGTHSIVVDAKDRVGNSAATGLSSFAIDLSAPSLSLMPPEGTRVQGPKPTLGASYSDSVAGMDLSTFKATLDGTDVSSGFTKGPASASFTPAGALQDGPHILRVEVADRAGNVARVSSLFTVESAFASVGPQGGTVGVTDPALSGFGTKIVIPPGALPQNVLVFLEEVANPPAFPEGYVPAGPAMDIGPSMVFTQPVTIAIPYDPQVVSARGGSPYGLRLLTFDLASGMWVLVPVIAVDTQNHLLLAEVTRIDGAIYRTGDPVVSSTQSLVGLSSSNVVADGRSFTTLTITPLTDSGSVVGPGDVVEITVNGVAAVVSVPVDLGNGVYQVFISSTVTGTAVADVLVNGVALQQQTISFSPVPATFALDDFTSPLVAGAVSNLRITARDQGGLAIASFVGSVEISLTGTRDSSSTLVYPETFLGTFTTADAGVLTLPSALLFAKAGTQQVRVTYLTQPAVIGLASVQVQAGPPAIMTKVAGDQQSGAVGSTLPQRLAVRVTDLFGNPVQGVPVQFNSQSGGAQFLR